MSKNEPILYCETQNVKTVMLQRRKLSIKQSLSLALQMLKEAAKIKLYNLWVIASRQQIIGVDPNNFKYMIADANFINEINEAEKEENEPCTNSCGCGRISLTAKRVGEHLLKETK